MDTSTQDSFNRIFGIGSNCENTSIDDVLKAFDDIERHKVQGDMHDLTYKQAMDDLQRITKEITKRKIG